MATSWRSASQYLPNHGYRAVRPKTGAVTRLARSHGSQPAGRSASLACMSYSRSGDQVPATPSAGHNAGFALLLTLSMAQFMVVLDFTIVNVALPSIQHGLHVATTTLQWLISGYAVAFGGFLLLGGRLADAYGRARLYRIGLVVFVVGAVAGGGAVEARLVISPRGGRW